MDLKKKLYSEINTWADYFLNYHHHHHHMVVTRRRRERRRRRKNWLKFRLQSKCEMCYGRFFSLIPKMINIIKNWKNKIKTWTFLMRKDFFKISIFSNSSHRTIKRKKRKKMIKERIIITNWNIQFFFLSFIPTSKTPPFIFRGHNH